MTSMEMEVVEKITWLHQSGDLIRESLMVDNCHQEEIRFNPFISPKIRLWSLSLTLSSPLSRQQPFFPSSLPIQVLDTLLPYRNIDGRNMWMFSRHASPAFESR